eukprot:3144446-Prymnesium_polylepis.1
MVLLGSRLLIEVGDCRCEGTDDDGVHEHADQEYGVGEGKLIRCVRAGVVSEDHEQRVVQGARELVAKLVEVGRRAQDPRAEVLLAMVGHVALLVLDEQPIEARDEMRLVASTCTAHEHCPRRRDDYSLRAAPAERKGSLVDPATQDEHAQSTYAPDTRDSTNFEQPNEFEREKVGCGRCDEEDDLHTCGRVVKA